MHLHKGAGRGAKPRPRRAANRTLHSVWNFMIAGPILARLDEETRLFCSVSICRFRSRVFSIAHYRQDGESGGC